MICNFDLYSMKRFLSFVSFRLYILFFLTAFVGQAGTIKVEAIRSRWIGYAIVALSSITYASKWGTKEDIFPFPSTLEEGGAADIDFFNEEDIFIEEDSFDSLIPDMPCVDCGWESFFLESDDEEEEDIWFEDEVPAPLIVDESLQEKRILLVEQPEPPIGVPDFEKRQYKFNLMKREVLRWFIASCLLFGTVLLCDIMILCLSLNSVERWRKRLGENLKDNIWFRSVWYTKCCRLFFLDDEPYCCSCGCCCCCECGCCCCECKPLIKGWLERWIHCSFHRTIQLRKNNISDDNELYEYKVVRTTYFVDL